MPDVLIFVSRQSSRRLFALIWAILLVGAVCSARGAPPFIRGLAALIGVLVLYGYPFLIILGFPEPYSTPISRGVATLVAVLLVFACVVSAIPVDRRHEITGLPGILELMSNLVYERDQAAALPS